MRPLPAKSISGITSATLKSYLSSPGSYPLRLPGLVQHWRALEEWTPHDSFAKLRQQVGEDTPVEVEMGKRGRGYLDSGLQRVTMPFGLFIEAFVLQTIPSSDPSSVPVGYLGQADLLDPNTPSGSALLAAAPPIPHFEAGPSGHVYRRTMWVGPAASFTPFHRDPNHGIYTHVAGNKTFWVLPPAADKLLKPSEVKMHSNTSTIAVPVTFLAALSDNGTSKSNKQSHTANPIDVADIAPEQLVQWRDRLGEAFALPGACRVELGAGDSVLIPEGWWHSAEGSGGPGVGVNAWFR